MKGCPLRCLWCGNPETQHPKPQLLHNSGRCIGCGACLGECPHGAISPGRSGRPGTDRKLCDNCGMCTEVCPSGARTMVGKYVSVEEALEEVKRDMAFYRRSGGGLTVGGGEPAVQPRFVAELLRRSKLELGLDTAVETCGFADYSALEMTLHYADLVFYDIKHLDSSVHKALTGVANELVMENLRRIAYDAGRKVVMRVPVLPGHNDSVENIRGIGALAAGLGAAITHIELLPYHNYGASKYARLGRRYRLGRVQPSSPEHLRRLQQTIMGAGVNVQIGESA